MTTAEVIIKQGEIGLAELISAWVNASRGLDLDVGCREDEALIKALEFRREIRSIREVQFDFQDERNAPDVLHALSRLLMDDCLQSPQSVFDQASWVIAQLEAQRWARDDLQEQNDLLCNFVFVSWRAARILGLGHEVQCCEGKYKRLYRDSLSLEVAEIAWESAKQSERAIVEVVTNEPEAIFQALLYLHGQGETSPEFVAAAVARVYELVDTKQLTLPEDLLTFFLGESARLAATYLRALGKAAEMESWANLSECHFESDLNPSPGLARVAFLRMTLCYEQSRFDLVNAAAHRLDRLFAELGMEEDRVKCRVVWSASLKLTGDLQKALEVLEPLRLSRGEIRPPLYGWVLLQFGDIHQLCGNYKMALEELGEAASLLRDGKQFTGLADVNSIISCIYRSHGLVKEALQLLKSSCEDHERLGTRPLEASRRLLIAETYLAMGRPREAELEVRAALPALEEQSMVPDVVIAINLLREAIRRQELDSKGTIETHGNRRPRH